MSNDHVMPVGSAHGIGPYGTNDMAGNVREWVLNATETNDRLILGGAWGSPSYLYAEAEALPPFDRALMNGVRGVRNLGTVPPAVLEPVRMLHRDFAHYTPASDAVFHAYSVMYAYDKTPLNASADSVIATTPDWKVVKVSYDAAYGQQRIAAYLYLPAHVKPPYQAVVFFPSARVLGFHDSKVLGDTEFFDYIVQSGRAVIYPVYQGTYERWQNGELPGASQALTLTTQRSKDVGRTLDYLQARTDIKGDDLAYVGVSMGAAAGAIFATIEQARLRTAVFLDGGFFLDAPRPGGDAADFVPRMKKPVLMVNGRYDMTFSLDGSQNPMFNMLGTPAAAKDHKLLEAAHDVTAEHGILVQDVLTWLDKYMGRVE
jgi:dienelactone hydrolase